MSITWGATADTVPIYTTATSSWTIHNEPTISIFKSEYDRLKEIEEKYERLRKEKYAFKLCENGGRHYIKYKGEAYYQDKADLRIDRVIFNDPATVIIWKDGTKTVVKAGEDYYDPEKGLAMAIAKKALGNEGNYYNIFRKWLPKAAEVTASLEDFVEAINRMKRKWRI